MVIYPLSAAFPLIRRRCAGKVLCKNTNYCLTLKKWSNCSDIITDLYAYMRCTFTFDQTPLKEVLKTLSDHYHVSFVCTDLSNN